MQKNLKKKELESLLEFNEQEIPVGEFFLAFHLSLFFQSLSLSLEKT